MKTLQQQETEAILSLGESHELQREIIYKQQREIEVLQSQLRQANEIIHQLQSQVYGGSVQ